MTRVATVLAGLILGAPALAAGAQDMLEPAPGVILSWTSHYDDYSSGFREMIVAAGDDWAIYQSLFDDDPAHEVGADDYYIVFSGIDYRACVEAELPDEAEREALAALALGEQQVLEDSSIQGNPAVRAGEEVDFFLMGETVTAREIVIDFAEDDEDNTDQTITVLGAHPYTAKIDWGDGTIDRLMLIAEAETVPDMPPAELLGDCAAFLNKTEQ